MTDDASHVEGFIIDGRPHMLPTMARWRKRPVVIHACKMQHKFDVKTLEGTMHGNAGDYLIQGVNGELYPCKPDVFAKIYEEVTEDD